MITDDEERQLRETIATLQSSYVKAAKPYVDRLAELNNLRATPMAITTRVINGSAMTSLERVERATVLMERYSTARRMVERYGNAHGDRDL